MRAATWATNRDITAAQQSWERATRIADALPADDPDRTTMRIAPRTMLCGIAWRVHVDVAGARFEELRELCTAAEDKASLAIGMAGLVVDHAFHDRTREASQLAWEAWALAESVGDPTLTVGLSFAPIYAKLERAEWSDVLRWSQRVVDLADGDPSKGNFLFGSPLALALTSRAMARYCLGRPEWRDDLRHGLAMARSADPMSYASAVGYVYSAGIPHGVLRSDDSAVREIEDALRIAERSGDDVAVALAQVTLGVALVHHPTDAEHDRGQQLLAEVSEIFLRGGYNLCELPLVNVCLAREWFRRGDRDEAIPLMRAAVDHLFREGPLLLWSIPATCVLVETLVDRGTESDVAEAAAAIARLVAAPADDGLVIREVWLLRRPWGRSWVPRSSGSLPRHGDIARLRRAYRLGRGDAMTAAAPSGVVTFLFTDIWVRPVGGIPTRNRCGRRCWQYIRWTPPGHSDVMVRADGARYKIGTGALGHVRVGGSRACGTRTSTRAGCKRGRRSCSGRRKLASTRRTGRAWSTTRPVSDQQQGNAVQAIGDDQLTPQSNQRAGDHLVETGQHQEPLPQATAPVVPDRGDDDPADQRHRYNGFQAHGPGLYAVRSSSEIRSDGLRRRIGAARAFGPLAYRWLANGPWPVGQLDTPVPTHPWVTRRDQPMAAPKQTGRAWPSSELQTIGCRRDAAS